MKVKNEKCDEWSRRRVENRLHPLHHFPRWNIKKPVGRSDGLAANKKKNRRRLYYRSLEILLVMSSLKGPHAARHHQPSWPVAAVGVCHSEAEEESKDIKSKAITVANVDVDRHYQSAASENCFQNKCLVTKDFLVDGEVG